MRIRKHAKLLYATPSLAPLLTHVCQLNQSPWDAMKFSPPPTPPPPPPPPPPPHQGDGDGVSDGNGSSGRRGSAPEREKDQQLEYCSDAETKFAAALCCKTDGKSWQCRREAAIGSTLCEHHVSQAKSYSGMSHPAAKKPVKVAARRAQAKKASAAAKASNPYEFYYYSGFGPRWGKKRGEISNDINSNNNCGSSTRKSVERKRKREDDEIERAVTASINEIDSDECEEEWNTGNTGKKRARKPIKARSLKSLM